MALWKPFRGSRADLDSVAKHDGYVYWCIDDNSLHFDYADSEGVLHRKQINADTLTGNLDSTQVTHRESSLSDIIDTYILNNANLADTILNDPAFINGLLNNIAFINGLIDILSTNETFISNIITAIPTAEGARF